MNNYNFFVSGINSNKLRNLIVANEYGQIIDIAYESIDATIPVVTKGSTTLAIGEEHVFDITHDEFVKYSNDITAEKVEIVHEINKDTIKYFIAHSPIDPSGVALLRTLRQYL